MSLLRFARRSSHLLVSAFALACARSPRPAEPALPTAAPRALPTPTARALPEAAPPSTNADPEPPARDAVPVPEPEIAGAGHPFQEPLPARELARDSPALVLSSLSP